MFALNLYWSWTNIVIVTPGNVCLDARAPNAVAISAHASTRLRLTAEEVNRIAVRARRADDCEC